MRWSTLTLVTVTVIALHACAAGAAQWGPARAEAPDAAVPLSREAPLGPTVREPIVAAVIALSNAERAKAGLEPLRRNESLVQAAQEYAGVLAPGPCFAHTCPPVPAMAERAERAGYTGRTWIGENISAGSRTAAGVVEGWMQSPGHRANILKPEYREIGVGVETGTGEYAIYWVQLFGARAP